MKLELKLGDALRNAAMRFGAALDLWHKGDLHGDAEPEAPKGEQPASNPPTDEQKYNSLPEKTRALFDTIASPDKPISKRYEFCASLDWNNSKIFVKLSEVAKNKAIGEKLAEGEQ